MQGVEDDRAKYVHNSDERSRMTLLSVHDNDVEEETAVVAVCRENFLTGFSLIKKQQNEYTARAWGGVEEINRLIGFRRPLNSALKRSFTTPTALPLANGRHATTRRGRRRKVR